MRMHGHAEHDPADYVPKEMFEEWRKKDPVELFEKALIEGGVIDDGAREGHPGRRSAGCHRRAAQGARGPDARSQHGRGGCLCRLRSSNGLGDLSGGRRPGDDGTRWSATRTSSSSARTSASSAAPSRSPRASWTSSGRAGWSTPRSPRPGSPAWPRAPRWSGLRPIVEFQFADFISCAFDPIINVLARHHYRTGDPMPVTMRAPFGARLRAGPTHSPERGVLLRARARAEDRDAGHPAGRRRAADQLDPGQQPDAVPGEQVPLPAAAQRPARCRSTRSRSAWRRWSGRAATSR